MGNHTGLLFWWATVLEEVKKGEADEENRRRGIASLASFIKKEHKLRPEYQGI